MILRVDYLIYVYIAMCICTLLFNLFYISRNKWGIMRETKKVAWWETEIKKMLEDGCSKLELAKIRFLLLRSSQFILFNNAMWKLQDEFGENVIHKWIENNRQMFLLLGDKYMKRNCMEKSFFAYTTGLYGLCGNTPEDPFVNNMLLLVMEPSVYCRENALFALYSAGSADIVVRAYILMNRQHIKHSRKLITDGLLEFNGDKKVLAEALWDSWDLFGPHYQVAFIDFIRMTSDGFCGRFLHLLNTDVQREVKFAVLRYFRKYYYEPAGEQLRSYVLNWSVDDWEFAAVSAAALEIYPGEETVTALLKGIRSDNWYVRDNASDSLLKITGDERIEEILEEMDDSFGHDMLAYKMAGRRQLEKGLERPEKEGALMMDAIKFFLFCVDIFFVIYLIGYSTFLFLSVTIGSVNLYQKRRDDELKNNLHHSFYVPISILVPAHNEEKTVVDTICTLLRQDYPLFEIVVVDDGSEDKTAEKLIEFFEMVKIERPIRRRIPCSKETAVYEAMVGNIPLTLIMKENGRKSRFSEYGYQCFQVSLFYLS